MASTNPSLDIPSPSATTAETTLLVSLAPSSPEHFDIILSNIALALSSHSLVIASPEGSPATSLSFPAASIRLVQYAPVSVSTAGWVLTAADFLNLYHLLEQHNASVCLLIGADCHTLSHETIQALAESVLFDHNDLVVPRYNLGAYDGLVTSAILYPVTRALYGTRPRFPLAIDMGLSRRMAQRLASAAQKFTAASQNDALIWPVAEAAVAGFSVAEIDGGSRVLPTPTSPDLNSLLSHVASSLFSDVDSKAAFWQRSRTTHPTQMLPPTHPGAPPPDIAPMIEGFRLAYTNLQEIWSLVLPPAALLGLKRLSQVPPTSFRMADSLWARIVYDFLLAFRLRTINRGHLLGALTPLYLAWVASHILLTADGTAAEAHIQTQATAFEQEKPYLVSRWRWPDRFNP